MNFRKLALFLTILVSIAMFSPQLTLAEKPKIVVFMKGLMGTDYQLVNATNDLNQYEWHIVTETLTAEDLAGASVLIIIMVDPTMTVTDEELTVINNWLDEGRKMIWVAGEADYGGEGPPRQETTNKILEAIGSKLRIDYSEVTDTESNGGKPYRVLGVSDNCDEEVKFLVAGVHRALFHGPGPVIAYENGEYIKLNEKKVENVYRVMWTTEYGSIVEFNPPTSLVYTPGEEGRFVVLAIELVPDKKNVIVLSGDAPFDHYTGMYKPELKRYERYAIQYPQQGAILFSNLIHYGVNIDELFAMVSYPEQISQLQGELSTAQGKISELESQVATLQSQMPMYLVGGVIVGLIIGFALAYFMKKK